MLKATATLTAVSFPEIFKQLLRQHGLNQAQFAKKTGTSQAYVSRLVNGTAPLPDDLRIRGWSAAVGWNEGELSVLLRARDGAGPSSDVMESLDALAKLAGVRPRDALYAELATGGLLYTLAEELAYGDEATTGDLRTAIRGLCELHRKARGVRAHPDLAEQMALSRTNPP